MNKEQPPRERAELREMARAAAGGEIPDLKALSPRDVRSLIHEFGVYQMELEAQNEELRETHLALAEARDRYRELYDFAPVGYFTLRRSGEILEANLSGCALLGEERQALIGRHLSEFLDRAGADDLYRHLGSVLETGERQIAEVMVRREEGAARCLRLESVVARDFRGQNFCRTAVTDITASKEAEEALRESEERFRALVTASSEGLYSMSPDWCEMRQLHSRGFLAETEKPNRSWLQEYIHPDDQAEVTAAIAAAIGKKRVFELEHRVLRADGSLGWTFSRAVPLLNAKGEIAEWFGAASDITERKRAEEALREAKSTAEQASEAKSEFLANMSHEIRTPMTVFMVALEHLLQIDRSPERRPLLEMADQSAQRLRGLIDDILDFSRIEARRVELEEQPFDLRQSLQRTVRMLELQAREKELRLEAEIAPEIPARLLGDSGRLEQVLLNLIGNAIKFTEEGEVRVSARLRDGSLVFAVSDTGIGIPAEKRQHLFESFTQADSSFNRRYGGTGLGLAICKGLVQLMGGEIGVESRPDGPGSVFFFTMPFKPADPQPIEAAAQVGREEAAPPGINILLAEDDPMIQQLLLLALAQRGWQADTAATGREAVHKWTQGHFDLILMDLQMPDMDGLEATMAIRKGEAEKHNGSACIVGLTAHARREVTAECLRAGMDQVLVKPVKMRDLFSVVEGCVAERKADHPR